jgi:hypothetical protein
MSTQLLTAAPGDFWSGSVARIVTTWPGRSWPTGQGFTRARRPGPERDPGISANPPMTGGDRP